MHSEESSISLLALIFEGILLIYSEMIVAMPLTDLDLSGQHVELFDYFGNFGYLVYKGCEDYKELEDCNILKGTLNSTIRERRKYTQPEDYISNINHLDIAEVHFKKLPSTNDQALIYKIHIKNFFHNSITSNNDSFILELIIPLEEISNQESVNDKPLNDNIQSLQKIIGLLLQLDNLNARNHLSTSFYRIGHDSIASNELVISTSQKQYLGFSHNKTTGMIERVAVQKCKRIYDLDCQDLKFSCDGQLNTIYTIAMTAMIFFPIIISFSRPSLFMIFPLVPFICLGTIALYSSWRYESEPTQELCTLRILKMLRK